MKSGAFLQEIVILSLFRFNFTSPSPIMLAVSQKFSTGACFIDLKVTNNDFSQIKWSLAPNSGNFSQTFCQITLSNTNWNFTWNILFQCYFKNHYDIYSSFNCYFFDLLALFLKTLDLLPPLYPILMCICPFLYYFRSINTFFTWTSTHWC